MNDMNRVKYDRSSLISVTYQINYPTILDIEANMPVAFQEAIREQYPVYSVQTENQSDFTVNVNETGSKDAVVNTYQVRKLHQFISEDQKWRVLLAKDMIAFSTSDYKYWEDMEDRAKLIIDALTDYYHPSYYTRIGLRYINAINKNKLDLNDEPWQNLINSHLCGCFGYNCDDDMTVRNSLVNSEISFGDVIVNIAAGNGSLDAHDGELLQDVFILNCDYYYAKRTALDELNDITSVLHDRSTVFFREAITEKLHEAMGPRKL